MLKSIKKFFQKNESGRDYEKTLQSLISKCYLTDEDKEALHRILNENQLKKSDFLGIHKKQFQLVFKAMTFKGKITKEDKRRLEGIIDYFESTADSLGMDQKLFTKYYTIGLIEDGELPTFSNEQVDVIFKKNETLHWGCRAELKKIKRVSNRINYAGPTASIKIMKGVRYRAGSIGYNVKTSEHLITDDTGVFWVSNQRLGFRGSRKNFSIPINKISATEFNSDGLLLFKEGRESPYMLQLHDYDLPGTIISHLLNTLD